VYAAAHKLHKLKFFMLDAKYQHSLTAKKLVSPEVSDLTFQIV